MKRYTIANSLLVLIAFALFLPGCKKASTNKNQLVGQWRQVNTSNGPGYVIVGSDMTITTLTTTSTGSHEYSKRVYQIESNTVLINNTLFQYSKSGDTLKLLQDVLNQNSSDNFILVSDATAPTLDTWMPMAVYSTNLPWPNLQMDALTTIGATIWTSYTYSGLKAYNTATSAYMGGFTLPNNVGGIEAAGSDLWAYDMVQRKLIKINPATQAVTFTSPAVPHGSGDASQLAYDGANSIYCVNGYRLDIYNIGTNSFNSYQLPDTYNDLAFADGYLFATKYSAIYKIDPATLKIVKTYRLQNGAGSDVIASAGGSDFWIYLSDGLQVPGSFQKITLN